MKRELIKNIEKYVGCSLTEKEKNIIYSLCPKSKVFEYLANLTLLSRINYKSPKLLNYFLIKDVDKDYIVLTNTIKSIKIYYSDILKNTDEVINDLRELTLYRLQDFSENVCSQIKNVLNYAKEFSFENKVKGKKIKIILTENGAIVLNPNDFMYLLDNLKSFIDLEIVDNIDKLDL